MNPNLVLKRRQMDEIKKVINLLLDNLPDSIHEDDESWNWCWEELSGEAQEQVKAVRAVALNFLKGENNENSRSIS